MPNPHQLQRREFLKGTLSLSLAAGFPVIPCRAIFAEPEIGAGIIPYGVGNWSDDAFDPRGNHRAVLRVLHPADAVRVTIPWRRHDLSPELIQILLFSAGRDTPLKNLLRIRVEREVGEFVFQPEQGPGNYYAYYLPYSGPGRSRNYPTIIYQPVVSTADPQWLEKNHLNGLQSSGARWHALPKAEVNRFESVDAFNTFDPMGIIATAAETARYIDTNQGQGLLLFPEDRSRSIRMLGDLPRHWAQRPKQWTFQGEACGNEFFVMQVGAYAAKQAVEDLRIEFEGLRSSTGAVIPASAWTCFNTDGVDWIGQEFSRQISIKAGHVQPLWLGVQVPEKAISGEYRGTVRVAAKDVPAQSVDIHLAINGSTIADHGDNDPDRLSRLRWLNSRLAEDNSIVPPYIPVSRAGTTIDILGRSLTVGPEGFPSSIRSTFAPGNAALSDHPTNLLSAPITLQVETDKTLEWTSERLLFEEHLPGRVDWSVQSTAGPITMSVHARLEFDGHIAFTVALSSTERVAIEDICLRVPYEGSVAKYMMGLGQHGGYRPATFAWRWDVQKNQDAVWVGDINAGMQVSLRDEHYSRPLNTNFYHLKPLVMPSSWANGSRGGCRLENQGDRTALLSCYSGQRSMQPGETLYYNFNLLLTPFKLVDTQEHWGDRYFHKGDPPPAEIKAMGANVINIHHGTSINPYLNYPFLRPTEMKAYIDEAHKLGMKVKIYYTVRELSNHAPEIFALRSLQHEIFVPGPGGGFSWLQEQLGDDYIAAWCVPSVHDAAIINTGASRWHNYYVEGVQWLAKNVGIDGIYLDDLAFDRSTMQRVRRILDRYRSGALIDLHSANQYDERDGYASSANLYMAELPYINRLWFGEYFDYNAAPDYYLIEMSGIPFGLMGEMLQGGGNPWRGMVYGMTTRLGASGDPRPLWKIWDSFQIGDSRMSGYWDPATPITTGRQDVLATSYIQDGAVLIAVASWANEIVDIHLQINWKLLGIEVGQASLHAPEITAFQQAAMYKPGDAISIAPGHGVLLILSGPK